MSGEEGRVAAVAAEHGLIATDEERVATERGDKIVFASRFLAHPKRIGSIIPSSSFLEQRIVAAAGIADARCVVELGPGTGGTTRAFLRHMHPQARLLAIELDPQFQMRLRGRIGDPRFAVSLGSAEDLGEILQAWRLAAPDVIISGIPFSTMDAGTGERIAAAIARHLAPGGRFVAYQVRAHVADFLAPFLGSPAVSWEWRNWPPMRMFRWVNPIDRRLKVSDIGFPRSPQV